MLKKVLVQVPSLMFLAGLLALGVNEIRSDRIPLVGEWAAETRFTDSAGEGRAIPLDGARALFDADTALFLDARPAGEYAKGHIRGALNLPWQAVEQRFIEIADRLAGGKTIITYCDGETCDLSHELARFLREMGFDNVRVLVNGLTLWQKAGLPTDGGS